MTLRLAGGPLGPLQRQATPSWLVHKDAAEGVDYSLDDLTLVCP
jgi:Rieske 2Fe-2S family protein